MAIYLESNFAGSGLSPAGHLYLVRRDPSNPQDPNAEVIHFQSLSKTGTAGIKVAFRRLSRR